MSRSTVMAGVVLVAALMACKEDDGAEEKAKAAVEEAKAEAEAAEKKAEQPKAEAPKPAAPAETAEDPTVEESPIPEIPSGRSKPPTVKEWREAKEVNTQEINSQPDACQMKIVREWLKVNCTGDTTHYSEMEQFGNENADWFKSVKPGKLIDFVVRLRPGKTMKVKLHRRGKYDAALFVNWPVGKDRPVHVALGRSGTND